MSNNLVFGFDARENIININNTTHDTVNLITPNVEYMTSTYHKPNILPSPSIPTVVDGETKYYAIVGESLSNIQTSDSNTSSHNYYHIRVKNIGKKKIEISNAITIEMKLYINNVIGTTTPNMVFCRRSSYWNGIIFFLTSTTIVLGLGTGGTNRIIFNNNIEYNKWLNFTITVTDVEAKLYLDGDLKETIPESNYTVNLEEVDVNADLLIGSGNPSATGLYTLDGYVQYVKIYNMELTQEQVISNSNEIVPCLTESCNILTPNNYINITSLKKGDIVTTPDNRNVSIIQMFKSSSKNPPTKIKAHLYGKNIPIIDTYLSSNHAYQINGKWLLPKTQNLPIKKSTNNIYYHIQLPNHTTDNLVVNGLITESWDGKLPL